jgi:malonyl-CoA/methylmalonyl-CoA synthetase
MTILDLLTASVRDRPGHTALVIDGHRLTYAQLEERSRRVATFLTARGFVPGDRLAIFLENEIAFVDAYFGALRAGIVVVPTNPLYRDRDAKVVWDDAEVRGIVSGGDLAAEVKKVGLGDRLIDATEIAKAATSFDVPAGWTEFDARPETIAFILFTSGTTGRAKGAMQSHNALAASAAQIRTAWHWRDDDVLCIALPLFHVHGLHVAMQTTLAVGATVVVERRFDAQKMCETLVREKATMFFGVPTMYVRFLERLEKGTLPHLRLWVAGSAALSAETWNAFKEKFGQEILERYGATETCMCITNRFRGPYHAGAVGLPYPGIRTRVIDPASLADVADGEVGELLINGPNVFSGYYKNPQATTDAFVVDADGARWFRSGDLARFDPAIRSYVIVGRLKELIITGGFNVYPREIEEEIELLPGIKECAVIGLDDPARGEVPYAFVAVENAASFDGEAMLAGLKERIASFKIPKGVEVLEAIPRNAMGKLDKPTLRTMLAERARAGSR